MSDPTIDAARDAAVDEALSQALAQHGLSEPDPGPSPLPAPEPLPAPAEQATPGEGSPQEAASGEGPPAAEPDPRLVEKALRVAPMEGLHEDVVRAMTADQLEAWHARYVERENRFYDMNARLAESRQEPKGAEAAAGAASTDAEPADLGIPEAVSEELSDDAAKALAGWAGRLRDSIIQQVQHEVQRASAEQAVGSSVEAEFDRLVSSGEIPSDLPSEARTQLRARVRDLEAMDGPWKQEVDPARAVSAVVRAALQLDYGDALLRHASIKLNQTETAQRNGSPNPGRRTTPSGPELKGDQLDEAVANWIHSEMRQGRTPSPDDVRKHFRLPSGP